MTADTKPKSKVRVILMWGMLLFCILAAPVFVIWRGSHGPAPADSPGIGHSIIMLVLAFLAMSAGILGYLGAVFTQCLTFNFNRPVWHEVKVKKYFANIIFPTGVMLGIGFLSSAVFTPVVAQFGLPGQLSFMLPFFIAFALSQCALIWVLVWAPLETRVIRKRLAALGISPEQMRSGFYIGLSNPAITSSTKRFYCIEEDVGMLWFTADQMIYWGDVERFSVNRADVLQVERKLDTKSTSILSGTAHVILHIRLPDGNERQLRLHHEGVWTMGGKRRASDEMGTHLNNWLAAAPVPAA